MIDFEGQFISCQEVARMKVMTQNSVVNLCYSLGINVYQAVQADLFTPNRYWMVKSQLPLMGIYIDNAHYYAEAA